MSVARNFEADAIGVLVTAFLSWFEWLRRWGRSRRSFSHWIGSHWRMDGFRLKWLLGDYFWMWVAARLFWMSWSGCCRDFIDGATFFEIVKAFPFNIHSNIDKSVSKLIYSSIPTVVPRHTYAEVTVARLHFEWNVLKNKFRVALQRTCLIRINSVLRLVNGVINERCEVLW